MDGLSWKIPVKIDDLGYPHFKKPPFPEKNTKYTRVDPLNSITLPRKGAFRG